MTSMGGTNLFGWMELNHFDREGAEFIKKVAENNAGLVLPGCQPVCSPMFKQWLHKKQKDVPGSGRMDAGVSQNGSEAVRAADSRIRQKLYGIADDGKTVYGQVPAGGFQTGDGP